MTEHVAIIGAGFSGTLLAVNLLRHDGPSATLIERAPVPGEGLAYGAAHPDHLLNVRAGNMSALPDDPPHLVRWLEVRGVADARSAFIPRLTYGAYLRELLEDTVRMAGDRLRVVRGDVVATSPRGDGGVRLALRDGTAIDADAAVLALGNLPPHQPTGLDPAALPGDLYFGDPWSPGIDDGLTADDTVLVIGTGLTMVDTVLTLDRRGFAGRIIALSRRGLVPRRHGDTGIWTRITEKPSTTASALVASVRARTEAIGWRAAVDELRPYTQSMWRSADLDQRRRFIRHLRPWWDVHRHRLAPPVSDRIAALIAEGRLEVIAAKTDRFVATSGGVDVTWRRRGTTPSETRHVRRIVNCTGPLGDLGRSDEPLVRDLVARGAIRPDAQALGIDVDPEARTIRADGTPNDDLYALGPMTRGAFWEIVAVPDIRQQVWTLARRLSNAHWVGGEGL